MVLYRRVLHSKPGDPDTYSRSVNEEVLWGPFRIGSEECAMMGESTVAKGGQIALPPEVASEIPLGEQFCVVVMWSRQLSTWRGARRAANGSKRPYSTRMQFNEQLIDDAAIR